MRVYCSLVCNLHRSGYSNYHTEYPSGNTPEWQSAIGLFVTNAANLMKAIKDTLRASKLAQAIPNNLLVSLPHSSESGANHEEQRELHSYAWWYSGLILILYSEATLLQQPGSVSVEEQ